MRPVPLQRALRTACTATAHIKQHHCKNGELTALEFGELLDRLEHAILGLDCMAAIVTEEGSTVFSNAMFRTLLSNYGPNISDMEPLSALLSPGHAGADRVRLTNVSGRSQLALRIPLPSSRCQLSLILLLDVDVHRVTSDPNRALQQRLELLQVIVDACAEGLMFVDNEGVVTYISDNYETSHDVKAENVIGRKVTEITESRNIYLIVSTEIPEIRYVYICF